MELHLVDISNEMVEAWKKEFSEYENVYVSLGNILEFAENTIVSPANSYGYMDGGIDRVYRDFFGIQIERTVQDEISKGEENFLPVGSSIVVNTNHSQIPYMIVAPTMFLPEPITPENCFYAMSAILNAYDRNSKHMNKIFCPGLGTGVGCVTPSDSAREMAHAYQKWQSRTADGS